MFLVKFHFTKQNFKFVLRIQKESCVYYWEKTITSFASFNYELAVTTYKYRTDN